MPDCVEEAVPVCVRLKMSLSAAAHGLVMDFAGQLLAEQIYQRLIVASTVRARVAVHTSVSGGAFVCDII